MEEQKSESSEHGIINYKLLVDLALQQAPKGEAGRLFREDGVKLEEVREMRIEFLNIVSLEHLWPMRNIRRLTLSHNCVERIEKLDDLLQLRELDLSFNRISVMEGLNHLVNLEILILSGNKIQLVEGIDGLRSLKIFSIANNRIDSWDHVMYLRKFDKLRSLNMEGNPCMQEENYRQYVIAFLPQILYLSYRMVVQEERSRAREIHRLSIAKTEESEMNLRRSLTESRALEEKKLKDTAAFVENLSEEEFFNLMFQNDNEGVALKSTNRETESTWEEFNKRISEISSEIYELGATEEIKRRREIDMFNKTINDEQNSVKLTARRIMNEITETREKILTNLKNKSPAESSKNNFSNGSKRKTSQEEESAGDIGTEQAQKIIDDFNVFLSAKWTKLMYNEVVLHEQTEDVIQSFRRNLSDMIDEFISLINEKFSLLRSAEIDYRNELSRIVALCVANNAEGIPEDLTQLCGTREALDKSLARSHELHLRIVDEREETMVRRLRDWCEQFTEQLIKDENSRHRRRILEISHFLQFQRDALEDVLQLQNLNIDKNIEADVAAALDE